MRFDPQVKRYCLCIARELLQKGQEVQKGYAEGWLQPVHLLAAICNEEHRQLVARLILTLNGMAHYLRAALGCDGELVPPPIGFVQEELDRRLREGSGEVADTMKAWELGNSKAKMEEWIKLAIMPQLKDGSFAFTAHACPLLHNRYISMVFVGFSDNTVLEQYVSQYQTISDLRNDSPVSPLHMLCVYELGV